MKRKDYREHNIVQQQINNQLLLERNKELSTKNEIEKEKLDFEKQTKDRADVSLKEYEKLKTELKEYKERCGALEHHLNLFLNEYRKINIPSSIVEKIFEEEISLKGTTIHNPASLSTNVVIAFEVPDWRWNK